MYNQNLNYLYWNPLTAGFVAEPCHWTHSRATDYFAEKRGAAVGYYFGWFLGSEISNREDTGRSLRLWGN